MKSADPTALLAGRRSRARMMKPCIAMPFWSTCVRRNYRSISIPGIGTQQTRTIRWISARISADVRKRLDTHGLNHTRSMLTEWNYGLSDQPPASEQRAAFITSALIYMQDAPIDAAMLYRADSVFGEDGATADKTGQALIALGSMKDAPVRLRVTGADQNGFAIQAGRSIDGRLVRILVSNYQIPSQFLGPRTADDVLHVPPVFDVRLLARRSVSYRNNTGFDLTVERLPGSHHWTVERCRISASEDFGQNATSQVSGPLHVQESLPPPGVELITLRAGDNSRDAALRHRSLAAGPCGRPSIVK